MRPLELRLSGFRSYRTERVVSFRDLDLLAIIGDTGAGIAPEDLPHVFERFYRADASRTRDAGGFGLGLSIAQDLTVAMGGTITVASELGLGSTFEVRLPKRACAAAILSLVLAPLHPNAQDGTPRAPQNDSIRKEDLRADLFFLAGDSLRGRLTDTEENRAAADFIASRFERPEA